MKLRFLFVSLSCPFLFYARILYDFYRIFTFGCSISSEIFQLSLIANINSSFQNLLYNKSLNADSLRSPVSPVSDVKLSLVNIK